MNVPKQHSWPARPIGVRLNVLWVAVAFLITATRFASAAVRESFETAEPSFQLIDRDCDVAVVDHRRSFDQPYSGQSCEAIRVRCSPGSKVYYAQSVTPARVIDELVPSIWVKSNRAGIRLLARVVFPRTQNPEGDGPVTALVHGSVYTHAGTWQRLSIEQVPKLVTEQVWFLRRRYSRQDVDQRGAFIDHIILNLYGGAGQTDVWIDDLEIAGHVAANEVAVGFAAEPVQNGISPAPGELHVTQDRASLKGTVLEAGGRPLMVKMIDHNGESFAWLQSLGFNTIRLAAAPTTKQLDEARQLGIWLVAPPPHANSDLEFAAAHSRVLAWDLGQQLTHSDIEAVRAVAGRVRRSDPHHERPLMCNPATSVWGYSRFCDVLVLGGSPIGSSFDLSDWGDWLRDSILLARGGRQLWAEIQTEISEPLVEQIRAFAPQTPTMALEPDQIRFLAYEAIAAGARGLAFRSRARLDANDHASWIRAATLQQLNLELSLVEPWTVGGTRVGDIKTNHPSTRVTVLSTDRSRLLIVRRHQRGQQFVIVPPEQRLVSFVDTGASSSASAFQIHPAAGAAEVDFRLQPGGVRVTLHGRQRISLIVVTSDPLVRRFLSQTSSSEYRAAAELSHRLAEEWLAETEQTLSQPTYASHLSSTMLRDDARDALQKSQSLLGAGDVQSAYDFAQRAMALISRVRSDDWQQATRGFPSPTASPFCRSHATLPLHWALSEKLRSGRWSANLLPSGDCENLNFMRSQGWRNNRNDSVAAETSVSLSPQAAHAGGLGLHLRIASKTDQSASQDSWEVAPLQITTAPIPVRAGQLVRIAGWVKIPATIRNRFDGLLIYDSIGGPQLAERIFRAPEWQTFTLYRLATRNGQITAEFALSGVGEVWLDDVTVEAVDLPLAGSGSVARQVVNPIDGFDKL